ncbi:SRPBCC family protein [Sphingomonas sanxanigenens]|uniref:Polyketide cyclase/dehydrase n=1 Tax=Sphingomonas sanxanigenens DSM 19645 = NX02 TaxID=1123269 RepID=W0ACU3_9SPHN|nr:SRPBCC domain-containing protein [Sphingomonas sanxanigenens]AHE55724.1 hypothetical protein NX02_20345 [Sphingomonas sanxanigenens DSM 19645 = NX02]
MRIVSACVAALACAAPLHAEVVSQDAGRFETASTVQIAAPPEIVWEALIKPNRWWSGDHTWSGDAKNLYLSAQAGGCFCELLPDVKGSVEHGRVMLARPGSELRLFGALGPLQAMAVSGNLHIALKPRDGGTEVTLRYIVGGAIDGDVAALAPAVDGVLVQQLDGLRRFAETPAQ